MKWKRSRSPYFIDLDVPKAQREVFPGVADYVCHYHFLRDIGNDLFGIEYARIRSELKKYSIRPSLRKIVKALE